MYNRNFPSNSGEKFEELFNGEHIDYIINNPSEFMSNFIKKYILKVCEPKLIEINNKVDSLSKELQNRDKTDRTVTKLQEKVSSLTKKVNDLNNEVTPILNEYSSKRARTANRDDDCVLKLREINKNLHAIVPQLGSSNKMLTTLHLMCEYLCTANVLLLKQIEKNLSEADPEIRNHMERILNSIIEYNNNERQTLADKLSQMGKRWWECVLFPEDTRFNSDTMNPYNNRIEEGAEIFVVALGLDLPGVVKSLPTVKVPFTDA